MRRLWVMALLLAGCASTIPLPLDVRVVPPVGVPQEASAFSGKWQGVWDGTLEHILVVEEIAGKEATVIYAYGDAPSWQISCGFTRVKGALEGSTLVLKLRRPATVTYRMRPDGRRDAIYEWQGGFARAVMTRMTESK